MLTVPSRDCLTAQIICSCMLHCRMVRLCFHTSHAVSLFFETPLYIEKLHMFMPTLTQALLVRL